MRSLDPPKKGAFLPTGVKKHRLWQSDNAVLLITELPSEITYIIDYFQWHAVAKSIFSQEVEKEAVILLANQEELIIDYDSKKLYMRQHKAPQNSSQIAKDLHYFYTTGNTLSGQTLDDLDDFGRGR